MIKQRKDAKGQKKALKRIKKVLNREIPDEELSGLTSNTFSSFFFFHVNEIIDLLGEKSITPDTFSLTFGTLAICYRHGQF